MDILIHIYNGILLSHKKEILGGRSFVEMWMSLESIIQSEVSQKEKNKYINAYVESRKMVRKI